MDNINWYVLFISVMKVKEELEKYSQNITGVPHYTVSLCALD